MTLLRTRICQSVCRLDATLKIVIRYQIPKQPFAEKKNYSTRTDQPKQIANQLTCRYDVEDAGALLATDAVARPAGQRPKVLVGPGRVLERAGERPRIGHGEDVADAAVARPREAHAVPRVRLDLAAQPHCLLQGRDDLLALVARLAPRHVCE